MEEKQFSAKKIGLVLCAAVFIILILLLTIRGCSVQKKDTTTSTNTVKVTEDVGVEDTGTSNSKESKDTLKDIKSTETEVTEKQQTDPVQTDAKKVDSTTDQKLSELVKVTKEIEGTTFEVNCAVASKSVYSYNGNYVFSVNILVPLSKGGYTAVDYFCNKNTYDAVNFGDILEVSYIETSQGEIGVISVSKQ